MSSFVPLDLPHDAAGHGDHAGGFLEPLLGFGVLALVVAVLVTAFLILRRRGLLPTVDLAAFGRPGRPEDTARRILAERFAQGDLSSEEFLERASALNWTPGVDTARPRPVSRR